MTLDQFDSLYASMARPTGNYVAYVALFVCIFIPATQAEAVAAFALLAGATAVLRTLDKKTAANAPGATAKTTTDAPKVG